MKLLLIDNNDSFTYNILDMLRQISDKNEVEIIKSSDLSEKMLSFFDKIIISPGPMRPKDFPILFDVIKYCFNDDVPLLGICLGHQAIGEYFGGELIKLQNVVHGEKKMITIDNRSLIYENLPQTIEVGLYHSWAIDIKTLPEFLISTSISFDNCLMSMQHKQKKIFSIQYHPESFMTPKGKDIMQNFLNIK